jgi:hypothetical protein
MQSTNTEIITAFDWRRFTATSPSKKQVRAGRPKKELTVRQRVDAIMARRWGNPYCRPGVA